MKIDALVTGGGPVGLAMAAELARYGVTVRIIDKAPQRTDKSKALVLWSRTLELFDRMGCTARFVAAGMKVSAANIVAGSKEIGRITLSEVATPYPYALMLPQCDTERFLEEQLNSFGVQLERGVELTQFTATADSVVSTLRHPDGRTETLETAWLLGCDGAHSAVRHQLGIGFVGDTLPSDWILADLHASGVPKPGEIDIAWHADGALVIFPIKDDRYRIIADVKGTSDPTLEDMQKVLDQRGPGGIKVFNPVWLANFHINERKVADYRAGRVFLAGDAAHIHSPAGGQGMNTGIQDACNLAWKLALVCHGTCAPEPLLDSYSAERSAVGDEVLKNAGRLTAVGILKGEIAQSIRNHVASLLFGMKPVREVMANTLTEISIGYPESPLNAHGGYGGGGPKAGERAPIRDGEKPVGAGDRPRFVLFADAPMDSHSALVDPQVRKPFHDGGIWLVRPDGYVAVATSKADDVASFLQSIEERAFHG